MEGNNEVADLHIYYEKTFPAQNVVGFFDGKVRPIFSGSDFKAWLQNGNEPLSRDINGMVDKDRKVILIRDFVNDLRSIKLSYSKEYNLSVDIAKIEALQISGSVFYTDRDAIGPIVIEVSNKGK